MRSLFINMWPDVYRLDAPFVCQVQGGLESLLKNLLRCIYIIKIFGTRDQNISSRSHHKRADFRVKNRKKGSLSSFIILRA